MQTSAEHQMVSSHEDLEHGNESTYQSEFTLIRAKTIEYLQKPAVAIYFQNMTKHVQKLLLESQILDERNRVQSQESFTSTISHEFRTPLSTSLMFLENLLR